MSAEGKQHPPGMTTCDRRRARSSSNTPAARSTLSIGKTGGVKEATAPDQAINSLPRPVPQKRPCNVGLLPLRDDAQEAVVKDLDGVDVKHPLAVRDNAEIKGVRSGPHGPRSLHLRGRQERQARQCRRKRGHENIECRGGVLLRVCW